MTTAPQANLQNLPHVTLRERIRLARTDEPRRKE